MTRMTASCVRRSELRRAVRIRRARRLARRVADARLEVLVLRRARRVVLCAGLQADGVPGGAVGRARRKVGAVRIVLARGVLRRAGARLAGRLAARAGRRGRRALAGDAARTRLARVRAQSAIGRRDLEVLAAVGALRVAGRAGRGGDALSGLARVARGADEAALAAVRSRGLESHALAVAGRVASRAGARRRADAALADTR